MVSKTAKDRPNLLYIKWLDDDTPSTACFPQKIFLKVTSPFLKGNRFVPKIQLDFELIQFGYH